MAVSGTNFLTKMPAFRLDWGNKYFVNDRFGSPLVYANNLVAIPPHRLPKIRTDCVWPVLWHSDSILAQVNRGPGQTLASQNIYSHQPPLFFGQSKTLLRHPRVILLLEGVFTDGGVHSLFTADNALWDQNGISVFAYRPLSISASRWAEFGYPYAGTSLVGAAQGGTTVVGVCDPTTFVGGEVFEISINHQFDYWNPQSGQLVPGATVVRETNLINFAVAQQRLATPSFAKRHRVHVHFPTTDDLQPGNQPTDDYFNQNDAAVAKTICGQLADVGWEWYGAGAVATSNFGMNAPARVAAYAAVKAKIKAFFGITS
jgi:hypothetical protein